MAAAARTRQLGWAASGVALAGLGTLALLWSPIANGFPFVYSDTGTYLLSAATWRVPADRPVGYSLFVSLTRLYPSVWTAVVVQAVITSALCLRAGELLLGDLPGRRYLAFGLLVAIAAATGLSGFVGYLMPDVFAGWIPLGATLFLLGASRWDRVGGGLAVVGAMFVHNGNVYLALAAALLLVAACALFRPARPWLGRAVRLAGLALLAVPAIGLVHLALGGGFTVSRGGPTHFANKLLATGRLDRALATTCPGAGWVLCRHLPQLAAHRGDTGWFLWAEDSPLREIGWDQGGGELTAASLAALRCCFGEVVAGGLADARQQLEQMSGVPAAPGRDGTEPVAAILGRHYPGELSAYRAARQQSGQPVPVLLSPGLGGASTHRAFVVASAAVAVAGLLRGRPRAVAVALAPVALVVLNALIVGLSSVVEDRLQSRLLWLLPAGALVGLLVALRPARLGCGRQPGCGVRHGAVLTP